MASLSSPSVVGVFADDVRAQQAVAALRAAGVAPERITVAGDAAAARVPVMGRQGERESPFILRLLIIIVLWSVAGTGVGAAIGVAFGAVGIGPQGMKGLVIQTVSWAIFAHLMAGMWAGYVLLANRGGMSQTNRRGGSENANPARPERVLVRVACADGEMAAVEAELRANGAGGIGRYAADGRALPPG